MPFLRPSGTYDLNNWSNQAMENAGLSGFETRFRKDVPSPEDMEEERATIWWCFWITFIINWVVPL